ncbi:D-Ala-D-Ala carboxypeptidase family metallohydrolase [Paraburkholderia azotifigens]|uniref:D-Ala-D-Ala carboxypeptidase family metallohydrolase n=1 Tax=Paraburkholderia azotifigens TaxID=2057004 RepID=UPI0038BCD96F
MNLSPHFTLEEFVASQTASRNNIPNVPGPDIVVNLTATAQALEKVRALLGKPIIISSGYRSPELNKVVKGAIDSAHIYGLAVDFIAPQYGTPIDICRLLQTSTLVFDQLIFEHTWVHLGLPKNGAPNRRQLLTAHFGGGPTTYTVGFA